MEIVIVSLLVVALGFGLSLAILDYCGVTRFVKPRPSATVARAPSLLRVPANDNRRCLFGHRFS